MSKNLLAGITIEIQERVISMSRAFDKLEENHGQLKTLTEKQDDTISDHDDQIKALEKIIEDQKLEIVQKDNLIELQVKVLDKRRSKKPKPK